MNRLRCIFLAAFLFVAGIAHAQQDLDLTIAGTFLQGQEVIKVKRCFKDEYVWALVKGQKLYRINSVTGFVQNFTTMIPYSLDLWTDIAAIDKDNMFIAMGLNIIQMRNGTVSLIGPFNGLNWRVTSIGISSSTYKGVANPLLIGTEKGLLYYDYSPAVNKVIEPALRTDVIGQVYEASYRNTIFHDGTDVPGVTEPTIHYSLMEHVDGIYGANVWLGNPFGANLRSAFFTKGSMWSNYAFTVFADMFWATENGLFHTKWGRNSSSQPYFSYLSGVQVNKISSIYGLSAFTYPTQLGLSLGRENLLVGTDQGLYFSNSLYQELDQGGITKYSFYHYADLGAKKINDISINSNVHLLPNAQTLPCEDGIWVAAADGLYLLRPDYSKHLNVASPGQSINFDGQSSTVNQLQLCGGGTAKIVMPSYPVSTTLIKWHKDGQEIAGANTYFINVNQAGDYYAELTDMCSGAKIQTNHLTVTVGAAPVFSFNYPSVINFCSGAAILQTDLVAGYNYRWIKDGVPLTETSNVLNVTLPGVYHVEVSTCPNAWVSSNDVQISLVDPPKPIISSDRPASCFGEIITLTSNTPPPPANVTGQQPYAYRWYKDGVLIPNENKQSVQVSTNGIYRVEISACGNKWVTSNDYPVSYTTYAVPKINPGKAAYCQGDVVTLSTSAVFDGNNSITWFFNDAPLTAETNKNTVTVTAAGRYKVMVKSNTGTCNATSVDYVLSFDNYPTISLQKTVNNTLCTGQTVTLQATHSAGTVKWSTGDSGDQISVTQSGKYSATVTSPGGCATTSDITVDFIANPTLQVANATLCQFIGEKITLTAPAGFTKYEWNGVAGGVEFMTDKIGEVNLTVTDANGCKATQTIKVSSQCNDIHIPNTFTPNADGVNDTWTITGLANDKSAIVKIYNRHGVLVFQNAGYDKPWDGSANGRRVPAGTYYYVITAQSLKQPASGAITVIY